MACITPQVIVKGFKKCCTSIAMDRTDYNVLYTNSEQDGNVASVMKTLTVMMESITPIGKGRLNLTFPLN